MHEKYLTTNEKDYYCASISMDASAQVTRALWHCVVGFSIFNRRFIVKTLYPLDIIQSKSFIIAL